MNTIILNNKPLVEAIFEVRWGLTTLPNGMVQDDGYDIVVGQLRQSLIGELPFHTRPPFGVIPGLLIPHQIQHQFRVAADKWPLVQIGPGILTVNDTEGYTSENFIAFCSRVFSNLAEFWKQNGQEPPILHVALRYIDADYLTEEKLVFLRKLGINITFEKNIFDQKAFANSHPTFVELRSEFNTVNPKGIFSLAINTGKKEDREAMLWETQMICNQDNCKAFVDGPSKWLSDAHNVCHDVFFSMIRGELEEKYK